MTTVKRAPVLLALAIACYLSLGLGALRAATAVPGGPDIVTDQPGMAIVNGNIVVTHRYTTVHPLPAHNDPPLPTLFRGRAFVIKGNAGSGFPAHAHVTVTAHTVSDPWNTGQSPDQILTTDTDSSGAWTTTQDFQLDPSGTYQIFVDVQETSARYEYDVTVAEVASTSDPTQPAKAIASSTLQATAAGGTGEVGIAQYASNPVTKSLPLIDTGTTYADLRIAAGSTFTSVSVWDCNPTTTTRTPYWWNTATQQWELVQGEGYSVDSRGCVTLTFTMTSTPSIDQFVGTPLAFGPAPTQPDPGPSATPEAGSGELVATGLVTLGTLLFARRRSSQKVRRRV